MMFPAIRHLGARGRRTSPLTWEKLGFSGAQAGMIYSLLPIGCMLAPFAAGQLADRYFSTEKLLAVFHLLGGVLLFVAARITHYDQLWAGHAGLGIGLCADARAQQFDLLSSHAGGGKRIQFGARMGHDWVDRGGVDAGIAVAANDAGLARRPRRGRDGLWLAGFFSIALGVFSFALPHTPPQKKGGSPWAFLSAIKLLRDSQFAVFIVISFVVATELMFYYVLTAPFLESVGIKAGQAPRG